MKTISMFDAACGGECDSLNGELDDKEYPRLVCREKVDEASARVVQEEVKRFVGTRVMPGYFGEHPSKGHGH